ncbi:MAG: hypothetical protein KatS3mg101_0816 [Patescibacteria group bacterium]|nr:MAG: hypothetical protein KatS3mg101_0816 [Patescibacteria group bacterium]
MSDTESSSSPRRSSPASERSVPLSDLDTRRKYCVHHYRCNKRDDPEHRKRFICDYKKRCRFGNACRDIDNEDHCRFFYHTDDRRRGSVRRFTRPRRQFEPRYRAKIEFNVSAKNPDTNEQVTISGVFFMTTRSRIGNEIKKEALRIIEKVYYPRKYFEEIKSGISYVFV